jgi:hypothetical protein
VQARGVERDLTVARHRNSGAGSRHHRQAPWIALDNLRVSDFVSRRVGNYQYNPQWTALLDQLWVK